MLASIGLVVAGDVVYNVIHPICQKRPNKQGKNGWLRLKLESLHPIAVVAGFKNPDYSDSPENIAATKKYIVDFEQLNNETSSAKELFDKMFVLYPRHGLSMNNYLHCDQAYMLPGQWVSHQFHKGSVDEDPSAAHNPALLNRKSLIADMLVFRRRKGQEE